MNHENGGGSGTEHLILPNLTEIRGQPEHQKIKIKTSKQPFEFQPEASAGAKQRDK
jgi:hypothetical protein